MIQLVPIVKRLVENEDIRISRYGIVVRRGTSDDGHIFDRLDANIVCVDIRSPESRGEDDKILSQTASVCICVTLVVRPRIR